MRIDSPTDWQRSCDQAEAIGSCTLATSRVAPGHIDSLSRPTQRLSSLCEHGGWSRHAPVHGAQPNVPYITSGAVSSTVPTPTRMSANVGALDHPPPYSIVAQESSQHAQSCACASASESRSASRSRHPSDPVYGGADGGDSVSVSSGDLLFSDDEDEPFLRRSLCHRVADAARVKRFNSTPQLSASRAPSATGGDGGTGLSAQGYRGLFLSLLGKKEECEPTSPLVDTTQQVEPLEPLPMAFEVLLHSLRLFAVVPGLVGTWLLLKNSYVQAKEGRWLRTDFASLTPSGIEFFICTFWSMSTAFHALSLMTMLLRRWLIYYTLVPSLIRLVTFQAICWSLVRLVLWCFGPSQPASGWIVISTFTSSFEIFARWITSNITDVDVECAHADLASDVNDTCVSDHDGVLHSEHEDLLHAIPRAWSMKRAERFKLYREGSVRVIRALTGAPDDAVESGSESESSSKPEAGFESGSMGERHRPVLSLMEMERWQRRIDERRWQKSQQRQHRRRRRRKQKGHMSAFFQNYRAARIHSRRVFHWNVAVWRNIVPIGVLGYVTLWVFLAEFSFRELHVPTA